MLINRAFAHRQTDVPQVDRGRKAADLTAYASRTDRHRKYASSNKHKRQSRLSLFLCLVACILTQQVRSQLVGPALAPGGASTSKTTVDAFINSMEAIVSNPSQADILQALDPNAWDPQYFTLDFGMCNPTQIFVEGQHLLGASMTSGSVFTLKYKFSSNVTIKHIFIQFMDGNLSTSDGQSFLVLTDFKIQITGNSVTSTWQNGDGGTDSFGNGFYNFEATITAGQELIIVFSKLGGGFSDFVVSAINFFGKERTAWVTDNISTVNAEGGVAALTTNQKTFFEQSVMPSRSWLQAANDYNSCFYLNKDETLQFDLGRAMLVYDLISVHSNNDATCTCCSGQPSDCSQYFYNPESTAAMCTTQTNNYHIYGLQIVYKDTLGASHLQYVNEQELTLATNGPFPMGTVVDSKSTLVKEIQISASQRDLRICHLGIFAYSPFEAAQGSTAVQTPTQGTQWSFSHAITLQNFASLDQTLTSVAIDSSSFTNYATQITSVVAHVSGVDEIQVTLIIDENYDWSRHSKFNPNQLASGIEFVTSFGAQGDVTLTTMTTTLTMDLNDKDETVQSQSHNMEIDTILEFNLEAILKSAGQGENVKNVVQLTYATPSTYSIAGTIQCSNTNNQIILVQTNKVASVRVRPGQVVKQCAEAIERLGREESEAVEAGDVITFSVPYTYTDKDADIGTTTSNFAVTVTVVDNGGGAVVGGADDGGAGGGNAGNAAITATASDQTADVYADTSSSFSLFGPTFSSEPASVSYSILDSSISLDGLSYNSLESWLSVTRSYVDSTTADAVFTQSGALQDFGINYSCTITFTLDTTYTTVSNGVTSTNYSTQTVTLAVSDVHDDTLASAAGSTYGDHLSSLGDDDTTDTSYSAYSGSSGCTQAADSFSDNSSYDTSVGSGDSFGSDSSFGDNFGDSFSTGSGDSSFGDDTSVGGQASGGAADTCDAGSFDDSDPYSDDLGEGDEFGPPGDDEFGYDEDFHPDDHEGHFDDEHDEYEDEGPPELTGEEELHNIMQETAEFMDPSILNKIAAKLNPYWQRKFALEDQADDEIIEVVEEEPAPITPRIPDITPAGELNVSFNPPTAIVPEGWQNLWDPVKKAKMSQAQRDILTTIENEVLLVNFVQNSEEKGQEGFEKHLTEFTPAGLKIKLSFSDPLLVSQGDLADLVEIRMLKSFFTETQGDRRRRRQRRRLQAVAEQECPYEFFQFDVPKQVRSQEELETLEENAQNANDLMAGQTISTFILQFVLNGTTKQLWNIFNAMQLITALPKFAIDKTPANILHMNNEFEKISKFQPIKKEQLYDMIIVPLFNTTTAEEKAIEAGTIASPITKKSAEADELNEAAEVVDEQTTSTSNTCPVDPEVVEVEKDLDDLPPEEEKESYLNSFMKGTNIIMQILLVVLALILFTLLITLVLFCRRTCKAKCCKCCQNIIRKVEAKLMFSSVLRSILVGYFLFCENAFYTLKQGNFDTQEDTISFLIGLTTIICLFLFPVLMHKFLMKNFDKLDQDWFKEKYQSVYTNVNHFKRDALRFNLYFCLRRMLFAFTMVILSQNSVFQILVTDAAMLCMCAFYLSRPMKDRVNNLIQLFNEIFLGICVISIVFCTDFIDDPNDRFAMAENSLIFVYFGCGLNVLVLILSISFSIHRKVKLAILKKKYQKRMQEIQAIKAKNGTLKAEQKKKVVELEAIVEHNSESESSKWSSRRSQEASDFVSDQKSISSRTIQDISKSGVSASVTINKTSESSSGSSSSSSSSSGSGSSSSSSSSDSSGNTERSAKYRADEVHVSQATGRQKQSYIGASAVDVSIDFDANRNSSSLLDDGSLNIFGNPKDNQQGKRLYSDPVFSNIQGANGGRDSRIQPQRAQNLAVEDQRKSRRAFINNARSN